MRERLETAPSAEPPQCLVHPETVDQIASGGQIEDSLAIMRWLKPHDPWPAGPCGMTACQQTTQRNQARYRGE